MSVFQSEEKTIRKYLPMVMTTAKVYIPDMQKENTIKIWVDMLKGKGYLKVEAYFRCILYQEVVTNVPPPGHAIAWIKNTYPKPEEKREERGEITPEYKELQKKHDECLEIMETTRDYGERKKAKRANYYTVCEMCKITGDKVPENFRELMLEDSYIDKRLIKN